MTLDALLTALAQATGPSRELDMLIGKYIGEIPPDAEWGDGGAEDDDLSKKFADFRRQHGEEWTTPAHTAHRAAFRAFVAMLPTVEQVKAWDDAHPVDTSKQPFWSGRIRRYSQSLDAALSLVREDGWITIADRRDDDGTRKFFAGIEFHESPFYQGAYGAATRPLCLCIAALKARRPA